MTFQDVRDALNDALRAAFGTALDLSDLSILGIIVAILAEQYALLWALAEQVYGSQDPDKATGPALDALGLLTGSIRPAATSSEVALVLSGTVNTPIPSGSQVSDTATGTRYATVTTVVLASAPTWATSTAYSAGAVLTNASKIYLCITSGTSASSGAGPTAVGGDVTDGSVHWCYVGTGTGYASGVEAYATQTGKLISAARSVTQIETPVGGWTGAINPADCEPGRAQATDGEFRLFREAELAGEGATTADAIRAVLLRLPDTKSVTVYHNDTDATDANGVPPHSVMALVHGQVEDAAANTSIAQALLANVSAGIGTHGTTSVFVNDSEGNPQNISFQRPIAVPIYVDITLTYDATVYPSDGDTEIVGDDSAGLLAWANDLAVGRNITASAISAQVFKAVSGVLDVSLVKIGIAPSPTTSTTIVIDPLHLATFSSVNITIHSSAGTL